MIDHVGLYAVRYDTRGTVIPVDSQQGLCDGHVGYQQGRQLTSSEIPYGTLDLMVLKILAVMGSSHGYGIARRIEQVAEGALALNQGTIYPALLRLEQKGWI